jgi:hypothetical protein
MKICLFLINVYIVYIFSNRQLQLVVTNPSSA